MSERINPWTEDIAGAVAVAEWRAVGDQAPLSPQAHEFWEENKPLAEMPSFENVLADVEAHPEDYQRIIRSQPGEIIGSMHNHTERTRLFVTEAEAISDMASYLDYVEEVTESHPDVEVKYGGDLAIGADKIRHDVQEFRRNLNYLSTKSYQEACKGFADMWVAYAAQGDDYVLNVWDIGIVDKADGPQKSWQKIVSDIYDYVAEQVQDRPEVMKRIRLDPDEWADTPHAKVIFVDDWILSGDTAQRNVARLAHALSNRGLENLRNRIEVHTLWSKADELGSHDLHEESDIHYTKRSYFSEHHDSRADDPYVNYPHISGAHSSVDYGFELDLESMSRFLSACGPDQMREMPALYKIDRDYAPRVQPGSPAEASLMQVAESNARLRKVRKELDELQEATRATSWGDKPAREAIETAWLALDKERIAISRARQDAVDAYFASRQP